MSHIYRIFGSALALLMIAVAVPVEGISAQNGASSRPNVFFDCGGHNCDSNYYRTEIDWVNWVRDRQDADVHLIMTSTATGAGGREYRLDFTGLGGQAEYVDHLLFQTLPTDTDREALDGIAHSLSLGLARFASVAGFRGLVTFRGTGANAASNQRVVSSDEVDDPWDLWVYRINGSGNLDGESTSQTVRLNSSVSAGRVSPTWKMNFNGSVNFNRVSVDLDDGEFIDERTDWSFNQLVVYSVADHWSIGVQGQSGRMTRFNQDFRVEVTPAVEYSVFPYEEATRRAFTFFYKIGPAYRNYIEETLDDQLAETRWEQSLEAEFSSRQTWGDASVSVTGSHFLHDLNRNKLELDGNLDFRIVRGFSVNIRGDIAWVDDQIYLAKGEATDEETLLRLRQRATSFDYGVRIGFSLQFGSIFNNVVNNRFGGIGGGGGGGGGGDFRR